MNNLDRFLNEVITLSETSQTVSPFDPGYNRPTLGKPLATPDYLPPAPQAPSRAAQVVTRYRIGRGSKVHASFNGISCCGTRRPASGRYPVSNDQPVTCAKCLASLQRKGVK